MTGKPINVWLPVFKALARLKQRGPWGLAQAFRKAIGVRIKEETEIIEGEVPPFAHSVQAVTVSCHWIGAGKLI